MNKTRARLTNAEIAANKTKDKIRALDNLQQHILDIIRTYYIDEQVNVSIPNLCQYISVEELNRLMYILTNTAVIN